MRFRHSKTGPPARRQQGRRARDHETKGNATMRRPTPAQLVAIGKIDAECRRIGARCAGTGQAGVRLPYNSIECPVCGARQYRSTTGKVRPHKEKQPCG
jgi:hypothetical protein